MSPISVSRKYLFLERSDSNNACSWKTAKSDCMRYIRRLHVITGPTGMGAIMATHTNSVRWSEGSSFIGRMLGDLVALRENEDDFRTCSRRRITWFYKTLISQGRGFGSAFQTDGYDGTSGARMAVAQRPS